MLQIAPMVDWTHSPFRLMMRLLLPKAKLFTEMLVPQAIIRHPKRYLEYYPIE
ncbi:MAG: tRNA-dihydrouridine synthase, partial [Pseudomonadota bacterium]|nr:tRNA-dihydrouridine synthase [Pseudomonadota bacterium]